METQKVGAGILNIITESLYDKPIVVFREYVQNSADSFAKVKKEQKVDDLYSVIWSDNNNLYFLDNGKGIDEKLFLDEMVKIASSPKRKAENIGYKGIGRLSGIPYCKKLIFVNICSFSGKNYQQYSIDGEKYNCIKKTDDYAKISFDKLMEQIGTFCASIKGEELFKVNSLLEEKRDIFDGRDTGFLVIMQDISKILADAISGSEFQTDLGWLLPVKFKDELFQSEDKQLFIDFSEQDGDNIVPALAYNVFFNGTPIERPIELVMLRNCLCSIDLKYAVGFHTFRNDRIAIIKDNPFSGIRIYIDNMLLCDENELLPALKELGFIEHTVNELIQSVKGIGAMIYITDKVNISANARRTFIEFADSDSIEFLRLLAEFVENIYKTRYALSKYGSSKNKIGIEQKKLDELRDKANEALAVLAQEKITVDDKDARVPEFDELSENEQKQVIKKKITNEINEKVKEYLMQTTTFDYKNAYHDFLTWLLASKT